jgi:hypothetical protein
MGREVKQIGTVMTHVESFKRPAQAYAQGCYSGLGNMTVQGEWCMPGRRHVPLGVVYCVFHPAIAAGSFTPFVADVTKCNKLINTFGMLRQGSY